MNAPSTEPTLEELERALDNAETAYICADYIDSPKRREFELAETRKLRDSLRAQVAAARARQGASA